MSFLKKYYISIEMKKDKTKIKFKKHIFFIRIPMKLVESRTTLLSNELKRHLFNLFASWSGPTSKLLGYSHAGFSGTSNSVTASSVGTSSNSNNLGISGTAASGTHVSLGNISIEEEKLQFGALQVSESLIIIIFII